MKKIFIIVAYSILLTILVIFVLTQLNPVYSRSMLDFFRELRGTTFYEGETGGRENFNIFFKIIIPIIFAISVGIVSALLFLINKNKR
jgi:hypothetical protein